MERTEKIRITAGVLILAAAAVLLAAGAFSGDVRDVWSKAVMVCLECIGIG